MYLLKHLGQIASDKAKTGSGFMDFRFVIRDIRDNWLSLLGVCRAGGLGIGLDLWIHMIFDMRSSIRDLFVIDFIIPDDWFLQSGQSSFFAMNSKATASWSPWVSQTTLFKPETIFFKSSNLSVLLRELHLRIICLHISDIGSFIYFANSFSKLDLKFSDSIRLLNSCAHSLQYASTLLRFKNLAIVSLWFEQKSWTVSRYWTMLILEGKLSIIWDKSLLLGQL